MSKRNSTNKPYFGAWSENAAQVAPKKKKITSQPLFLCQYHEANPDQTGAMNCEECFPNGYDPEDI